MKFTLENQNVFSLALVIHLHKTISIFLIVLIKVLDTYNNYDNILLTGDFNAEGDELFLSIFLYQHYLFNLVRVGTCSRNSSKPTSVDLFLTSKITHFQNIVAVCSGLSDFHKLVLTVLKTSFDKKNPVKF